MDQDIELASAGEEAPVRRSERRKRTHIFRAPAHIRDDRIKDFEPKLVSIGPYYHGRDNLKHMEELKLPCAYHLEKQVDARLGPDLVHVLEFFKQFESQARNFYKENFNHSVDKFVRMLFLDSCFIIQVILSFSEDVQESMFSLGVNIKEVRSDLLLFENQIPLFFIKEVYHWLFPFRRVNHRVDHPKPRPPFETVLIPFISLDFPWRTNHGFMSSKVAHLLELYWTCYSSPLKNKQPNNFQSEREQDNIICCNTKDLKRVLCSFTLNPLIKRKERSEQDGRTTLDSEQLWQVYYKRDEQLKKLELEVEKYLYEGEQPSRAEIHRPVKVANATVLHQMAGVKFELDEGHHNGLNVIFSNGIIRMPCLNIDPSQKSLLVNLIAYENSMLPELRTFSSYMKLMDALIDSEKDVELLQQCGVIHNTLISHKMAATFFNDIGNFCDVDHNTDLFPLFYENVKKYYDSSWNRRWASLRHNHFSSPWAGISVFAGVTLLILSALQTFYTIYPYYHPN